MRPRTKPVRARAGWLLHHGEEIAAAAGLVLVVAATIYNIVNRYLLMRSAAWAPELAGMVFAWVVFLGASAAWRRHMHVSISVVVRFLPRGARAGIEAAGSLVLALFLAYATYLAAKITISAHSRLSPVMRVPFSYVYASAAVGFGIMFLRQAADLARQVTGRAATDDEGAAAR